MGSIFIDNRDAIDRMNEVDRQAGRTGATFGEMIGSAAKWGAAIGIAAVGVATAFGIKAVRSADDFNKAMNGLAAETAATNEEMTGFKDVATRIYNNNFGENFEDIAKSMAEVKKTTGLAGDELEKATTNALLLRDTFEFDVSESTRTVNSLIKQFGITGDEAYTLIAQGAQNGANKNGDLLDSLNEYAPQFKALGFDASEFTNVLIDGAKNGAFSIDKVGDAVKEFTIRSKDMSSTSVDAFKSLGLGAAQMSASFAKGGESAQTSFGIVLEKLSSIKDPIEQNRIGVELFGTQWEDLGASGVLALGQIGTTANSSKDTLQEMNAIKYDTLGEAITGIGRNFETGLVIPLGEKILPKINEFAAWVTLHMPEIKTWFEKALNVVNGLFDGLARAIKWVTDNGNILLPIVIGLTAAIAAQAVIGTITKAYKAWQLATASQTAMQWLLNVALNANPLGLVALAVGVLIAAGVLLYKNWDTVKLKLGQFWAYMKEIGGNIKEFFGGVFGGLADGFKWYVNKWVDALNFLIRGLNKIHFNLPDWIPGIGGKGFGININEIPHLKDGTDNFTGGMALVGEKGPEIVRMPRGSQVIPNKQTEAMLDKQADGEKVIHVSINMDNKLVGESVSKVQYNKKRARSRALGVSNA